MRLLVVVVAYNNEIVLARTLEALAKQLTDLDTVCVVDNNSAVPVDLPAALEASGANVKLIRCTSNLGFTGGNNLGLQHGQWREHEAVLLLNPDLILPEQWIAKALGIKRENPKVGILSGPLERYDFRSDKRLGTVDSMGIGRCGFLRSWQDIGQGDSMAKRLDAMPLQWHPAAICGALMLIPCDVIATIMTEGCLFDPRFFAYKEDIDLSLSVRKAGFFLLLDKRLLAFHGRGWRHARARVPMSLRKLSARNDVYLHWKHRSPYLLVSLLKWIYVMMFEKPINRLKAQ